MGKEFKFADVVLGALIIALSLATYGPILDNYFTATDTFTLIETSRLQAAGELLDLFSDPLMQGSQFVEIGAYYRPISSLSYSLDFALWGLNPAGYQLTNLTLHTLVSLLLFLVVLKLTDGDRTAAFLSSLIFGLQPMLFESVPAIARRHDMIAALFILLSVRFYLSHARRMVSIAALISCGLALASKEMALVLPAWLFLLSLAHNLGRQRNFRSAAFTALVRTWPFFAIAIAFVMIRSQVLGELPRTCGGWGYLDIVYTYCRFLLYPVTIDATTLHAATLAAICGFGLVVFFVASGPIAAVRLRAANALLALVLLVSGAFVAYSLAFLPEPESDALQALPVVAVAASITFLTLLRSVSSFADLRRAIGASQTAALAAALMVWLVLPLAVFLFAETFSHRNMYLAVIPLSALTGLLVSSVFDSGLKWVMPQTLDSRTPTRLWVSYAAALYAIYVCGVSPLVRCYEGWEESGEITRLFLVELAPIVAELSSSEELVIRGLPDGISPSEVGAFRARSVSYLESYSVESWTRLAFDKQINVRLLERSTPEAVPKELKLVARSPGEGVVTMDVVYE